MIYKINMSKGDAIKIDSEDLQKIKLNIQAPLITIKQAIINPSFMISIIPLPGEKEFDEKYELQVEDGKEVVKRIGKVASLDDLMSNQKLLK